MACFLSSSWMRILQSADNPQDLRKRYSERDCIFVEFFIPAFSISTHCLPEEQKVFLEQLCKKTTVCLFFYNLYIKDVELPQMCTCFDHLCRHLMSTLSFLFTSLLPGNYFRGAYVHV